MKATFFLSILALAARVVLADMPPACLLHAVNTADNPADMNAVCGNGATDVQSAIASMCSGSTGSVAQSAFIDTCSSAGKKVAAYTATGTASSGSATRTGTYVYTTAIYNSSCSCTQTIVTSADRATMTDSNAPSSTTASAGGAGPAHQRVGGYAAAAIALVGAVAAL